MQKPKISTRISPEKYNMIATAARRRNETISSYTRAMLESIQHESKTEKDMYIVTRLVMLVLAQYMPPEKVMENYSSIRNDADEKFGGE